jgi:NAD(P)-dependent dehydrogenase (short-subunit alcohol dehydrogenase family)
MNRVLGKVALVTGGAKGIGRSTALLLASEGAKIVVSDLDETHGAEVVAEIRKAGGEAVFMQHDVTDEAAWERVIAAIKQTYGALNIVVNNAGIGFGGTAEDTPIENWQRMMSINLDSVFLGTKHAIIGMKGGIGSIVNISSIEGIIADPSLAAYNASKGGVRIFSKSAALHCAKSGYKIRVNSVHPGYIWTPMVENHLKQFPNGAEIKAGIEALHPVGRMGDPDDIAYGILYLASDESKFVTGSELVIDGGYTAQ